jgi:hypothetical protein
MRTVGIVFIAFGILVTMDTLFRILGVISGTTDPKWVGPVLIISGAGLLSRGKTGPPR